jgi:hypothetical protein
MACLLPTPDARPSPPCGFTRTSNRHAATILRSARLCGGTCPLGSLPFRTCVVSDFESFRQLLPPARTCATCQPIPIGARRWSYHHRPDAAEAAPDQIGKIVYRSALFRRSTCCVDQCPLRLHALDAAWPPPSRELVRGSPLPSETAPGLNGRPASGPISGAETSLSAAIIQALFLRGGMRSGNGKSTGFQPLILRFHETSAPARYLTNRDESPRIQAPPSR